MPIQIGDRGVTHVTGGKRQEAGRIDRAVMRDEQDAVPITDAEAPRERHARDRRGVAPGAFETPYRDAMVMQRLGRLDRKGSFAPEIEEPADQPFGLRGSHLAQVRSTAHADEEEKAPAHDVEPA